MTFKRFWCHFSRLRSSNCSHIKHNSVFFGSLLEGVVGVSREGGWDTPRRVAWSISREGGSGPPPPTLLHRFASSFAIAMSSLSCFPPTGPAGSRDWTQIPIPEFFWRIKFRDFWSRWLGLAHQLTMESQALEIHVASHIMSIVNPCPRGPKRVFSTWDWIKMD